MCLEGQKKEDMSIPDLERRERACVGFPVPRAVIWRLMGQKPREHSSAFQACLPSGLPWVIRARGPLVIAADLDLSHGVTPSDFGAFLDLEQEHSGSLDVTFQGLMLKGVVIQGLWFCPSLGTRSLHPSD